MLVFTAQNRHARVHVSPRSMMVAVAGVSSPSLPPQHSPRFGHRASSHTVARLSVLSFFRSATNRSPPGSFLCFSQSGLRSCCLFCCFGVGADTLYETSTPSSAPIAKDIRSASSASRRSRSLCNRLPLSCSFFVLSLLFSFTCCCGDAVAEELCAR